MPSEGFRNKGSEKSRFLLLHICKKGQRSGYSGLVYRHRWIFNKEIREMKQFYSLGDMLHSKGEVENQSEKVVWSK